MKKTNIKVKQLTAEEILNHKEQAYNPTTWKKRVSEMLNKYNATFYEVVNKEKGYTEFYTAYKLADEKLFLFNNFSAYSSMMVGSGFKRVFIIDGEINVIGFGLNQDQSIVNDKVGRKWLAENICAYDVMISNRF